MIVRNKLMFAGLAACLCLSACEQPNWEDPNYVAQQLETGDAATKLVAFGHLKALDDEKKKVTVPVLTKLYLEGAENQDKFMDVLLVLRDPAAKDAYLKEVEENKNNKGGAAAEVLGEIKAKDAIDAMSKLYTTTDSSDVKQGILRGFTYMPDAQMVPVLVETLKLDVDNNPIALHAYSCDILGDIVQEKPEALDDAGRAVLVRSIFLANNKNQNVGTECGIAVQKLGKAAIPELLKTFKLENKQVQQLMMSYNFPNNQPKGTATTRLGTLQAKEVAPLIIEDIDKERELPASVSTDRNKAIAWLSMEAQSLSEEILVLGDLGAVEGKEKLIKAMNGEYEKVWDEMKNAVGLLLFVQLRQDAAKSLNRIGDRSVAGDVLKAAQDMKSFKPLVDNLKAVAAHNKTPVPPAAELYSYNVTLAQVYANLADASAKEGFEKWANSVSDEGLKKELLKIVPAFDLQKECASKGDAKAQATCYGAKVDDQNSIISQKATYELMRLPTEVAAPVIASKLGTDNLEARELISFAAYRHPSKEALAAAKKILEDESSRTGQGYALDRRRLKYLAAWLANNT